MATWVLRYRRSSWRSCLLLTLGLFAAATAVAHTVDEVNPFHLSPEDYFVATVAGAPAFVVGDVSVQCTPVGGGGPVAATPLTVDGNEIGIRLSPSIALGEYEIEITIGGTAQSGTGPHIWVRQRRVRLIKNVGAADPFSYSAPATADFKEADFADVDQDGALDVYAANSEGSSDLDMLFMNQANRDPADCALPFCEQRAARFTQQAGLAYNRTYDADFVDVDGDGDLDLVRTDNSASTPLRIFVNQGDGNFDERTVDAGAVTGLLASLSAIDSEVNTPSEMDFGNINGVGRDDILICSWAGAGGRVAILLNETSSTGKFRLLDPLCGGGSPHALCDTDATQNRGCALGDFNNDGALDILAPIYGLAAGVPLVLLNTGNNAAGEPQFTVHSDRVKAAGGGNLGIAGGDLKVADLDGDGDDDVAVTSPGQQGATVHARILWNDNGNALREITPEPTPFVGDSYDVAFSDLDADGDLDVIFANEFEDSADNWVLINHGGVDGNLLFKIYSSFEGMWFEWDGTTLSPAFDSSFELSVTLGDYDLDGDNDLVGAGFDSKLDLWENGLFRVDGERRDWVFVLDRTQSMVTGHDFFTPAKNALVAYLGERYDTDVAGGDRVGLVTYDYTGPDPSNVCAADEVAGVDVKAQRIFEVGAQPASTLVTHVEALDPGTCDLFCTSVGAALRAGLGMAADATTGGREKVVVLITDGRNNQCPSPVSILPTAPSDTRIYVVAMGDQTDDSALAQLASNRGKFYVAGRSDDYESVQAAMRDINADLEADSTGKHVLAPVPAPVLKLWAERANRPGVFAPIDVPSVSDTNLLAGVAANRRVHRVAVDPADSEVRFTLSWKEANDDTRLAVFDPKGRAYPIAGSKLVQERRGAKYHVIEVLDPLSGVWTAAELARGTTGPLKFTALASSTLRVNPRFEFPIFLLGEDLRILVSLDDQGQPVPISQLTASFLSPSEATFTATATSLDERELELVLPALDEPGTWRVTVSAVGTAGRPFVRQWHSAVHVTEPKPGDPDLRRIELSLSNDRLEAGSDTATVTARLFLQDGSPLIGAEVSFDAMLAELQGSVTDHGDGTYSQLFKAGEKTGVGSLHGRAGLFRYAQGAEFEVIPAAVSPDRSTLHVRVGLLAMCANFPQPVDVVARPVDIFGNRMIGASVDIERVSGLPVSWTDQVTASASGASYLRHLRGPGTPGSYVFGATVNGTSLVDTAALEVFGPDSPEGQAMQCSQFEAESGPFGLPWWLWLIILLLLLIIVLKLSKGGSKA